MARPTSPLLTDREAEIMSVLWELGPSTSQQIGQKLSGKPHGSTVRTLLRILAVKGHVKVDSEVRPAIFTPAMKQRNVRKKAAAELLKRFFGGSAEELVLHLLDDERLSADQLKELEQRFANRHQE
jgi:BlaI family transcriptional regulator, penicillinase repressor